LSDKLNKKPSCR